MKRWTAVVHLVGLVTLVLSTSVVSPETELDLDRLSAEIDALLVDLDRPDGFAATIGIVLHGDLIYRRDFGLANREHGVRAGPGSVYSLASMSKQFTAFAVLILVREGSLQLTDDIRTVLPEMPAYDESNPITIADLIHHTSGLRDHLTLAELIGVMNAGAPGGRG